MDYKARYLEFQRRELERAFAGNDATLRFGVDCSNGMASMFAKALYSEAIIINSELDGRFPCHSPNPLNPEARKQLAELVQAEKLDCGVIFDGDADRAMFIDERGEFIQPDYLIPLVARATPGESRVVLHDVRTSRGAIETLCEDGFEPVMVPVGHAFAKPKMRELKARCGGELAGHYYFGDFFGCDSGLLAASRILGEFRRGKASGKTVSQLMAPIMSRYANSGELNFKVEDKDGAIERVLKCAEGFGRETSRSEIDGVRIDFEEGWINVRKSNTEPYLRLLVEAKTAILLEAWEKQLTEVINEG